MSSVEIVLGNLFGRLFFILALLFASLPLFAITQYFGGVPGRSIFTSYLIAACAALLVGTIAIALSVSRLVGRRAVFAFYVSVVTYLAVTWALDAWLRNAGMAVAGTQGVTWMTAINPFLALYALLNPTTYPAAPAGSEAGLAAWFLERPVATWCWGSTLLSVALMAASTLTVRTGGLQGIGGERTGPPWYRRIFGLPAKGSLHRPPRHVWTNPIAWREAAARNATLGRIIARWTFVGLGGLFGLALVAFYHGGSMDHPDFRLAMSTTVWAEIAVIALIAMNMAATAISREREDGTLDILLTTPITQGQYINGKLRGLIAYLLPMIAVPVGTLLVAGGYVLAGGLGRSGGVWITDRSFNPPIETPVILPEGGVLAAVMFVPFIACCVMAGLYYSLGGRGTIGSVVKTVATVGVIGGIIGLCGWNAGGSVPLLGPALAAWTPASLVFAITNPPVALYETAKSYDLTAARAGLAVGALVGAGIGIVLVYAIHKSMLHKFDMTVRRLAGAR